MFIIYTKMSIKGSIDELDRIKSEIARNNAHNRSLRQRANTLEEQISSYLQKKSQSGVKYNGRTIILETKERRGRKDKVSKERDAVFLLRELRVEDPVRAYSQLVEAQKGETIPHQTLKIKRIKE